MLIELNVSGKRLVVDTARLTGRKYEELGNRFVSVRKEFSLRGKHPPLEGESLEDWSKRLEKVLEEEYDKKEDESTLDYLARVEKPNLEKFKIYSAAIRTVADAFDQSEKVAGEECFLDTSYVDMKDFVKRILKLMDFNEEYFD